MVIQVLYFAAVRDLVGKGEERLEFAQSSLTLGGLVEELVRRYPALLPRVPSLRLARNESFAPLEEALASEDTVALIPPVAGG